MGTWTQSVGPVDDPLEHHRQRPVISVGAPGAKYLGRVVIELWDDGTGADVRNLAFGIDAIGDSAELLTRVVAAFPARASSAPGVRLP